MDGKDAPSDVFEPNTRGTQALLREATTFSLAVDHHHWALNGLLSLTFFVAHGLFIAGQVLPLWQCHVHAKLSNVSIDCPGILNVSVPDVDVAEQLISDSYAQIVSGMWVQGDVGKDHPQTNLAFDVATNAKLFAALICLFSGCWPHTKLVAAHVLWYARHNAKRRTRAMMWLEFFGKWSMVDVLAIVLVCTVFAVTLEGPLAEYVDNVLGGFQTYLDTMVNPANLSHVVCNGLDDWPEVPKGPVPSPSPGGCHDIVTPYFDGENDVEELLELVNYTCEQGEGFGGDVSLVLDAETADGVYFFSSAVWLSLLVSAFTNLRNEVILIHRHKTKGAAARIATEGYMSSADYRQMLDVADTSFRSPAKRRKGSKGGRGASSTSASSSFGGGDNDDDDFYRDERQRAWQEQAGKVRRCNTLFGHAGLSCAWNVVVIMLALGGFGLFYCTQFLALLERTIVGSTSYAINLLNNETFSEQHNYTMWDNALMILHGSGTNPFLQKDLVIFCIVGPGACLLFALLAAVLPLPRRAHFVVSKLAGLGFTFSGIEVLAFGAYMTSIILPVQSASLITVDNDGGPPINWCKAMDHLYGFGQQPCFYEDFTLRMPEFLVLPGLFVVQVLLYLAVHHATRRVFPTNIEFDDDDDDHV